MMTIAGKVIKKIQIANTTFIVLPLYEQFLYYFVWVFCITIKFPCFSDGKNFLLGIAEICGFRGIVASELLALSRYSVTAL